MYIVQLILKVPNPYVQHTTATTEQHVQLILKVPNHYVQHTTVTTEQHVQLIQKVPATVLQHVQQVQTSCDPYVKQLLHHKHQILKVSILLYMTCYTSCILYNVLYNV